MVSCPDLPHHPTGQNLFLFCLVQILVRTSAVAILGNLLRHLQNVSFFAPLFVGLNNWFPSQRNLLAFLIDYAQANLVLLWIKHPDGILSL